MGSLVVYVRPEHLRRKYKDKTSNNNVVVSTRPFCHPNIHDAKSSYLSKKDYLNRTATYSSMRQNSNQFAVPDVILSTMTGIMGFKEVAPSTVGEGILETSSDFLY